MFDSKTKCYDFPKNGVHCVLPGVEIMGKEGLPI